MLWLQVALVCFLLHAWSVQSLLSHLPKSLRSLRPNRTIAWEQVAATAKTGDLVFWEQSGDGGVLQGLETGKQPDGGQQQHMSMGMVVHLPHLDHLLLWEPVVWDHSQLTTGESPTWGGSIRLTSLEAALRRSQKEGRGREGEGKGEGELGGGVFLRRLQYPKEETEGEFTVQLQLALKAYWRDIETMPGHADLSAHGSNQQLESAFCAWAIAATLEKMGLLQIPAADTAHAHGHFQFAIAHFLLLGSPEDMEAGELTQEAVTHLHWQQGAFLSPAHRIAFQPKPSSDVRNAQQSTKQASAKATPSLSRKVASPNNRKLTASTSSSRKKTNSGTRTTRMKAQARVGGPIAIEADSNAAKQAIDPFSANGVTGAIFRQRGGSCDVTRCESSLHLGVAEITMKQAKGLARTDVSLLSRGDLWIKLSQHPRTTGFAHLNDQGGADSSMPIVSVKSGDQALDRVFCTCVAHFPKPLPWYTPAVAVAPNGMEPDANPADREPTGPPIAVEKPLEPNYMYEMAANEVWQPKFRALLIDFDSVGVNDMWGEAYFDLQTIVAQTSVTLESKVTEVDEAAGKPTSKEKGSLVVGFRFTPLQNGFDCTTMGTCLWERERPLSASNKIAMLYYENWSKTLVTGDFLSFKGTAVSSELAANTFGVLFTHAAIVYLDPTYNFVMVYHAVIEGVLLNSLRHYAFSGQEGMLLTRRLHTPMFARDFNGNVERVRALAQVRHLSDGKAYNSFWGVAKAGATGSGTLQTILSKIGATNNDDQKAEELNQLFCSELVAEIYQALVVLPESYNCDDPRLAGRKVSCNSDVYQPTDFFPMCGKDAGLTNAEPQSHDACGGFIDFRISKWAQGRPGSAGYHLDCPSMMMGLRYKMQDLLKDVLTDWQCTNFGCQDYCLRTTGLDAQCVAVCQGRGNLPNNPITTGGGPTNNNSGGPQSGGAGEGSIMDYPAFPQGVPLQQEEDGMSDENKLVLYVVIGGLVGFVLCCGLLVWYGCGYFYHDKHIQEDMFELSKRSADNHQRDYSIASASPYQPPTKNPSVLSVSSSNHSKNNKTNNNNRELLEEDDDDTEQQLTDNVAGAHKHDKRFSKFAERNFSFNSNTGSVQGFKGV